MFYDCGKGITSIISNNIPPESRDGQEPLISFPALPEKNMLIPEIPVLLPVPVDIPVDVCHPVGGGLPRRGPPLKRSVSVHITIEISNV